MGVFRSLTPQLSALGCDFNAAALWAGLTAFVWYAFGVVPLRDAFEKAFTGDLKFGALVAFAVAATPFAFAGITSAFWAIVAGLGASLMGERTELVTCCCEGDADR